MKTEYLTLYALTGSPLGFPSAFLISGAAISAQRPVVSANGSASFDLAVDLDLSTPTAPRIRVMPVRTVAVVPGVNLPSVSLARTTVAFDQANTAPTQGWIADTAQVVAAGETIFVQTNQCNSYFSSQQYSKLVVDSIYPDARKMRVRVATDPNCGQRSFPTPGFPPTSP